MSIVGAAKSGRTTGALTRWRPGSRSTGTSGTARTLAGRRWCSRGWLGTGAPTRDRLRGYSWQADPASRWDQPGRGDEERPLDRRVLPDDQRRAGLRGRRRAKTTSTRRCRGAGGGDGAEAGGLRRVELAGRCAARTPGCTRWTAARLLATTGLPVPGQRGVRDDLAARPAPVGKNVGWLDWTGRTDRGSGADGQKSGVPRLALWRQVAGAAPRSIFGRGHPI